MDWLFKEEEIFLSRHPGIEDDFSPNNPLIKYWFSGGPPPSPLTSTVSVSRLLIALTYLKYGPEKFFIATARPLPHSSTLVFYFGIKGISRPGISDGDLQIFTETVRTELDPTLKVDVKQAISNKIIDYYCNSHGLLGFPRKILKEILKESLSTLKDI